jgi:CheY-like chemotaxis protein
MGGHISVTSKPGLGSTFLVDLVLPVAEDEVWNEPDSIETQDLSGVRALVIDDIALNCRIAIGQLGQHGIFGDHETNPREGLRRLAEAHNRRQPYDLLILDYQMPGMDGLKVAQLIRSKPAFKRLKIIVQSSVDTAEVKEAFLEAGITAFLVKPLRSGALGAAVNAAFAGAKPQAVARAAMAQPEPARSGGLILVAEDNEVNQRVMAGLLSNSGYELHFAGNGEVAVDLFRRNKYALVLMDVSMPVMDGMAATRMIRELEAAAGQKRTPIIAVTAHAMAEEAASFLERGVDQVLTKPINQAELYKALAHWGSAKARQAA